MSDDNVIRFPLERVRRPREDYPYVELTDLSVESPCLPPRNAWEHGYHMFVMGSSSCVCGGVTRDQSG